MQQLTEQGQQKINDLARHYGVSTHAVMTLLQALVNGNGTMAQFHHRELGGGGQWMRGGMTMVGDMFNHALKARVDGLCSELSTLLSQQPFQPSALSSQAQFQGGPQHPGAYGNRGAAGNWWPADLGVPNASGGQNQSRYAYFANARRLAVEANGHVTVYDTLGHQIGGVSQQQGGGDSLTFASQYGTVRVADLPVLSVDGVAQSPAGPIPGPSDRNQSPAADEPDIFAKIERLADLLRKGILSPEEFATKKAELLSRL